MSTRVRRRFLGPGRAPRVCAAVVIACGLSLGGGATPGLAVQPDEILSDPALEARARSLSAELRCLVCQNQSIDDSDAPLARDLRKLVRERLVAGDSDEGVMAFIVARYGEYVLLRPSVGLNTLLLWFGPPFLLLLGGGLLWRETQRSRVIATAERAANAAGTSGLNSEEEARLARLLKSEADRVED